MLTVDEKALPCGSMSHPMLVLFILLDSELSNYLGGAFFMKKSIRSKSTIHHTTKLVYTAILIALAIALNAIELNTSALGLKLTLSYIPIFTAGTFLGVIPGFLVGILGDGLAQLVAPQPPWIPFITIASGIIGVIPGLIFKIKKVNPYVKIILSMLIVFFVCTVGINSIGIYLYIVKPKPGSNTFFVWWLTRIGTQTPVLLGNTLLLCLLYAPLEKLVFSKIRTKKTTIDGNIDEYELLENIYVNEQDKNSKENSIILEGTENIKIANEINKTDTNTNI